MPGAGILTERRDHLSIQLSSQGETRVVLPPPEKHAELNGGWSKSQSNVRTVPSHPTARLGEILKR